MHRPALVLVGLLLAAGLPPGARAEAAPLTGEVEVAGPLVARGAAALATRDGALDLTAAAAALPELSWGAAAGHAYVHEWTEVHAPGGAHAVQRPGERTPASLPAGRLDRIACGPSCLVLLFADGAGEVGLAGRAEGAVGRAADRTRWFAESPEEGDEEAFVLELPSGSLVAGPDAGWLADATAVARGRVGLLVVDALVETSTTEGPRSFDVRFRRESAGLGAVERVRTAFLVLTLDDATASGAAGAARLVAPSARLAVDGEVRLGDATGELRLGARRILLAGEDATVAGALVLDATGRGAPGGLLGAPAAPVLDGRLGGEATRVALAGGLVPAAGGGAAARWALPAAVLVAAACAAVALYTRLDRSRLLANPNRQRILDHLASSPGASVTELARALGVARVVVQHHLRQLAGAGLVLPRTAAGRRGYFRAQSEEALRPAAHLVLRHDDRRAIAEALLSGACPPTQAGLAGALALRQRKVSYHLAELEAAGLVRAEGAQPRRYKPTLDLVRHFEAGAPQTDAKAHGDAREAGLANARLS